MKTLEQDRQREAHTGGSAQMEFSVQASELEEQLPSEPAISAEELRANAAALVAGWEMAVPKPAQTRLPERLRSLGARLAQALETARSEPQSLEFQQLLRARRVLQGVLASAQDDVKALEALPHVHIARLGVLPRVANLAEAYMDAVGGIWSMESFAVYVREVQVHHALLFEEVQLLPPSVRFAQLEYIVDSFEEEGRRAAIPAALLSLQRVQQFEWDPLLESMVGFDGLLRADPGGCYAGMNAETRQSYRRQVARLARDADFDERETAQAALEMAREAQRAGSPDARRAARAEHIGYFLFAEGLAALKQRIGYHPPPGERMRGLLLRYNEDFYLIGIIVLSVLLIVPVTAPLVPHNKFLPVMLTLLLALLPVTQGAVEMVNALVQMALKAEPLPKLDFAKGVPAAAATLVAIPTLLLHERQIQELFEDLEARYLSNEDPNIHFALLTDLPDSAVQPPPDEGNAMVQMAVRSTESLNAKYARSRGGSFFLLHRRRVFNHRQGVWMGWERKRGKLLDLNKLLLHEYDSFPIKSGPTHLLDQVRYVITLDADTTLPAGAAERMIGTIFHPLNRAIIDAKQGIVTVGYGLLQPRVGVSVASASRSRLAAIYSGETGLDMYTRAVSDVYQDLFGEGIFTGKGIYEVSVLHTVLERRFPRNSLLSHDLIEGAYVRAGLVSDVEVIDDYPSQYHAHTRRRHRWIRGDWQILRWLFSPVPDESGRMVTNPISSISKWKILDNLRRSLVEPVTFLLLVFGWFFLPGGAVYWTVVTLVLLLSSSVLQLAARAARALFTLSLATLHEGMEDFATALAVALIQLTFLAHQVMLSVDAIARSITRTFFSGRHLLEWETAAQAEASRRRTSLDLYLDLSPVVAMTLAAAIGWLAPRNLFAAGPVLCLWAIAPFAAKWLNSPARVVEQPLSEADRGFLREHALRIWRFYADHAGPESHWLVPDHVEERDLNQVRLLTPTNIGMLLNARLAAVELGFLTLPEFVEATAGSLESYGRMERYRGHLFNWYDLVTLRAIRPVVVSTVDSGNLAAALYTLRAAALDLLKRPLLGVGSFAMVAERGHASVEECVRELFDSPMRAAAGSSVGAGHERRLMEERERRRAALAGLVTDYMPWLLPRFRALSGVCPAMLEPLPGLEAMEARALEIAEQLSGAEAGLRPLAEELRGLVEEAGERMRVLLRGLKAISDRAEAFAEEMDFGFLFVESRQLLSNGFDMETRQLHTPCFDLLASEARTAAFLAVAKSQARQQSWFRLGRPHTLVKGRAVLLSWTATMFEHLMPGLWMQAYPDTLLSNSLRNVVEVQREHVRQMPWGISESGYAGDDEGGNYLYQAWGIPSIALKYRAEDGPVISPYSTFLALGVARGAAIENLRRMEGLGWVGEYGFYEAADYTSGSAPRLVRSWMAHHLGMSLLAITNALCGNVFQTWFHANPRVRSAEQLLHEKPLSKAALNRLAREAGAETHSSR